MDNELYFHDGNLVSISIGEFDASPGCQIVLNLYRDAGASNRTKCVLCVANVSRFSLLGDFLEMNANYFAGVIVDGHVCEVGDTQRVTLRLAGGYLEIFGKVSVDFS